MSENTGFFSQITKRRIPQFLGIYLAASWTAMEFTQWAVEIYGLSRNWEQLLVVLLLLCLPLVVVLAWQHGAPGKQKWSLFEKIYIPINLLAIPLVLSSIYLKMDFSPSTNNIASSEISAFKSTSKQSSIKKILVFPLNNISKDESLNSVAIASSEVLRRDLSQNKYIIAGDSFALINDLQTARAPIDSIPLSLQIKLTKEKYLDYFANGTLNFAGQQYQLKVSLYTSVTGKKLKEFIAESTDYFTAIDIISEQVTNHLLDEQDRQQTDLPIGDLYTYNFKAFKTYAKSRVLMTDYGNHEKAIALLIDAAEQDDKFALANLTLVTYYAGQNQIANAKNRLDKVMPYKESKFTEREKYSLSLVQLSLTNQLSKTPSLVERWITAFPDELEPYQAKASIARVLLKKDKAIKASIDAYENILRIDPTLVAYWGAIGDVYLSQADYDNAIIAYNKFIDLDPTNQDAYRKLGNYHFQLGKYDSSNNYYQQILLLNAEDTNALSRLALSNARLGKFEESLRFINQAIELSLNPAQEHSFLSQKSRLFWNYGQYQNAIKSHEQSVDAFRKVTTTSSLALYESQFAVKYFVAGEATKAQETLKFYQDWAKQNNATAILLNIDLHRAELLAEQQKFDDAIELAQKAKISAQQLAENTSDSYIEYLTGRFYAFKGDGEKAISSIKPYTEENPDNINNLKWLARAYMVDGQYTKAQETLNFMLRIAPGYPEYNLLMAKILIASDKANLAKEYLAKSLVGWKLADENHMELEETKVLISQLEKKSRSI
ncbi:tetratricopeptide repeat protein [Kangiella sp. HZ709]|uniref:tetratricopeptide repeat protein n=1 Tax=Kangiella sp. HZ709 TaxID=2666328 RepID=UPI0012B13F0F|nr:tetratricopeptide repeat protein [Kangiella sp. HZ709]MRX27394.1 tetratricopeptide repeat protein [Kangiella sp. HZ709]